ncbi:acyl transferase/acyl hydrolase/lysophospholipase [Aspergillus pseudonomiae]|uniref:Acyl transferase/acyl hydrolase/lysophospholipase n=1 Tax=Aspergillus pseudonomiae TaxID=1506151 RepID=A0A5N7D970_9EURO|nr:acyl transferase/acyl hydrolase/lysophospholipase [Aspergillus pseudonomiae]KAE8402715.1 acyl transferase/acyl hydrolase/lysophospholipase [Aspergillus pseudonomiae]
MLSPFTTQGVENLPALPDKLSSEDSGQYVVKCEQFKEVKAEDGNIEAAIWFRLPPITPSVLRRIQFLQLFAESGDQGFVGDRDAGTWTWFELAILENEEKDEPMIKNNIQYVWKSHLNPMETPNFKSVGNVIAIRICARFKMWAIRALKGYLAVQISKEPATYEPARFERFKYLQNALQELNEKNDTDYDLETPPMRADGFDAANEKPLRVLCLDGGGVRGLSSLHILRNVMQQLGTEEKPAKPCEVFDMIAGTSTGGLCAIMLGRLRMSVDECIHEYEKFMNQVFTNTWREAAENLVNVTKYNTSKLENVLRGVIKERTKNEDEPLLDEGNECKVFVLSIDETAVNNKSPVFLRSYTNTQQPSLLPNIKIWEAGRATSAAPTYFGPMQVGGQKLIDGGLGANNPVGWLWNEVLSVYGAGRPISCFLSIGTGIPKNRALGGIFKLPTSLAANATNSEIMHILFRTLLDAYAPQTMRAKYWRLNVGHEIPGWPEDPKAAKKNDLPELDDIKGIYGFVEKTEQYITQQADLIRRCVETIQESR